MSIKRKEERERFGKKLIRLKSSSLACLCLAPKTTTMGRPVLSTPCINNLLWESSLGISEGDMEPLGTKDRLQLRYLRNRVEAFSMSRSRALRNRRIIKSSSPCQADKFKIGIKLEIKIEIQKERKKPCKRDLGLRPRLS